MDNKGSISSEIIIVLIAVVLIVGAIVNFAQTENEKIADAVESNSFERLVNEMADNLISNPGNPQNWHELERPYGITPGLAVVNEDNRTVPNSLSYLKFTALGKHYDELIDEKVFDRKIASSITIKPINSNVPSMKIGSEDFSDNVFTVERHVQCDFFKKYSVKNFQDESVCNSNHMGYSCNYFKVFPGNLLAFDYYLLVDDASKNSLYWSLDSTHYHSYFQTPLKSEKVYLNPYIEANLLLDSSAVIFIHLNKEDVEGVVAAVPKEFDDSKLFYDYFRTNDCQLTIKASLN